MAKEQREAAYRLYITDSFYLQGQGKAFRDRFFDLMQPHEIDTRSGEEIAADIIRKLQE